MKRFAVVSLALLASACGDAEQPKPVEQAPEVTEAARETAVADQPLWQAAPLPEADKAADAPLSPPEPGQPGGLPDDRSPVSEGPFTPDSAQGGATVVQTFFALLEAGKTADAMKLWKADGAAVPDLETGLREYRVYRARSGAPGQIEAAAGFVYLEVPVQIFGRLNDGTEFNKLGAVRLSRPNQASNAAAEDRAWRIVATEPRDLLP
jgi:hypothetical protein